MHRERDRDIDNEMYAEIATNMVSEMHGPTDREVDRDIGNEMHGIHENMK